MGKTGKDEISSLNNNNRIFSMGKNTMFYKNVDFFGRMSLGNVYCIHCKTKKIYASQVKSFKL